MKFPKHLLLPAFRMTWRFDSNITMCNDKHQMRTILMYIFIHISCSSFYKLYISLLKILFLCVRVIYFYIINLIIILCVAEKLRIISNKCFINSRIEPSSHTKCRLVANVLEISWLHRIILRDLLCTEAPQGTQPCILTLRGYEPAPTLLHFASPILRVVTAYGWLLAARRWKSSLCRPDILDVMLQLLWISQSQKELKKFALFLLEILYYFQQNHLVFHL